MRLNPDDPKLLLIRSSILQPSAALDVLAKLARVPAQREEADRQIERVKLGLAVGLADDAFQAEYYSEWGGRLMSVGKVDRAMAVVSEGIAKSQKSPPEDFQRLKALRAMLLALQSKFDESIKVQTDADFPQLFVHYAGLADILLMQKEPKLAIASFGDKLPDGKLRHEPTAPFCGEIYRVLSWSYSSTGQADKAVAVLNTNPDLADKLLLLRIFLDAGKENDAEALGDDIAATAAKERERYANMTGTFVPMAPPPYLDVQNKAASLIQLDAGAVQWMDDHHPRNKEDLAWYLGSPTTGIKPSTEVPVELVADSEYIPRLKEKFELALRSGDDKKIIEATNGYYYALWYAQRYREAAHTLSSMATSSPGLFDRFLAQRWCDAYRRAQFEELFQNSPEIVQQAQELLDIPGWRAWNMPHQDDGLNATQRINKLRTRARIT